MNIYHKYSVLSGVGRKDLRQSLLLIILRCKATMVSRQMQARFI